MAKQPDDLTARTVDAIIWVVSEVGFDGHQWTKLAEELNSRGVVTVKQRPFNSESLRSFCKRHKIDFTQIRMPPDLGHANDPESLTIMRLESKTEILKAAEDSIHPVVKTILASRDREAVEIEEDGDSDRAVVIPTTHKEDIAEEPVTSNEVDDTTKEPPTELITVRFDEVEPSRIPHVTTPDLSPPVEVGVVEIPEVFSPVPEPLPQLATQLPQWLLDDMDNLRTLLEWWKTQGSAPQLHEMERRPVFRGRTRNTGIRINCEILDRAVDKSKKEKNQTGGNLSQLVEWLMWRYLGEPLDVVEGSERTD